MNFFDPPTSGLLILHQVENVNKITTEVQI